MTDTSPRDLADRFQQRWLEHNPFAATMYGIPGYDHLLPDESEAGEQAWRAEAGRFGAEAGAITAYYVVLRLPLGLKELFTDWLSRHFPERVDKVLGRIRDTRGAGQGAKDSGSQRTDTRECRGSLSG